MKDCGPFKRQGVVEYVRHMSKPRTSPIYDGRAVRRLSKLGIDVEADPQSIYDPEQLWAALRRYSIMPSFTHDEWIAKAYNRAKRAFGYRASRQKLKPLKQVLPSMVKLDKSAGVYFLSKADAFPAAERRSCDILNGRKSPNPCIAYARTQRGNRTRLVWGYPLDMTLLESRFGLQLIDLFKEIRTPITYSLRRFELGARLASTMRGRQAVALDFSKFDSSLHPKVIRMAFKILKTWFEMDEEDERAWEIVINYFINTPIVMIDGHLYKGKRHGVPSGSLFTQLVDSVANYILTQAVLESEGVYVPKECHHVLGDDSILSTNSEVNLLALKQKFERYGLNLNAEKSGISESGEAFGYLGTEWKDGIPYVSLEKMVRSATQPERWRNYPKDQLQADAQLLSMLLSITSLGVTGWEINKRMVRYPHIWTITQNARLDQSYLTGYTGFRLSETPCKIWFNMDTGVFV